MRSGDSPVYNCDLFPVRINGFISGSFAGNGIFCSAHDSVCYRNCWNQNYLDFLGVSTTPLPGSAVYFLSRILDCNHCDAGDLFLVCEKESS